jgi:hypothetical protein
LIFETLHNHILQTKILHLLPNSHSTFVPVIIMSEPAHVVAMQTVEEAWDRFIMIVKPEQSGKTFVMIKKINEFLDEDASIDQITVNFIFCDNSLLLTKQTKERICRDVYLPDVEEPYVELSSRKDGSAKNNSSEVRDAIEDGCMNVVCCTNEKRVIDIMDIIRRINTHNSRSYKFKIWLDEADKFDNYIKKSFIPLAQKHENVEVYMLTATPQPIFKTYKEVRTMALENTTLPIYHGWNDCIIKIREDEAGTPVGFARQIADEMLANGELVPGAKGYVPAGVQIKTHHSMRDMFIFKGVAVFTVNSEGIELTLPMQSKTEPKYIKINKSQELHIHIRELYTTYNVSQYPCVITGNINVGRGVSIQQPDFMFTFGILSNCSKKTEASQNAGRMKGNFKGWPGYIQPHVYTTQKFHMIASEYEEQSRKIAELAFHKNGETEGTTIITNEEVKNIIKGPSTKRALVFDTFEEAKDFALKYFGRSLSRPRALVPYDLRKDHPDHNPTAHALKNRLWGLSSETVVRLYPTEDEKFCMYWDNKNLVDNMVNMVEDAYNDATEKQVL